MSTLRERALSSRVGTACAAIQEMIESKSFELSDEDMLALEERDDLFKGWVFSYRIYRSQTESRSTQLNAGLSSKSPRTREHACDLIGDFLLKDFREKLVPLFTDKVPFVAEAAIYNHQMLSGENSMPGG